MARKRKLAQHAHTLSSGSGLTSAVGPPGHFLGYSYHDDHLRISQENAKKNGIYQSGGPFYLRKEHYGPFVAPECFWSRNGNYVYRSPYIGRMNNAPIVPDESAHLQEMTDGFVEAWGHGATGWARSRPGNPLANATIFGGELRRLPEVPQAFLPYLLYRRLARFRALGNEYLNVVFGWIPFVKEVQALYGVYRNIDRHLAQLIRNNGKGIRRSRTIRDDHSHTVSKVKHGYPWQGWSNIPPNWTTGFSNITIDTETIDKIWFEARFRYFIPDIGSSEWTRRATKALYGANITPDAVYNLLPWSWMIDWFSNLGDVISNMSENAVDNLTADYAYIMRTKSVRTTITAYTRWNEKVSFRGYIPAGDQYGVATNEVTTKLRAVATPYGFGVDFGGLSPYRLGVLAALGISRSNF